MRKQKQNQIADVCWTRRIVASKVGKKSEEPILYNPIAQRSHPKSLITQSFTKGLKLCNVLQEIVVKNIIS